MRFRIPGYANLKSNESKLTLVKHGYIMIYILDRQQILSVIVYLPNNARFLAIPPALGVGRCEQTNSIAVLFSKESTYESYDSKKSPVAGFGDAGFFANAAVR